MTRARQLLAPIAAVAIACQASTPSPAILPTPRPVRVLAVIVSAAAGAPVPGVAVCAFTVAGSEERCGETNATGTARLSVRPGTYSVRVTAKPETRLGAHPVWTEVVDKDATAVVHLEPRSRISGTVRDQSNAALEGAEVCAHPPTRDAPTCTKTSAQGTYSIEVRSDPYKLDVSGPPGRKLIPQWARGRLSSDDAEVFDARTKDVDGIDVVLAMGVLLTGVVRGPDGVVENAQVCLRTLAAPLPWQCERTKKNGSYLALREPGSYYMWTVPPDNVRLVAQWYDSELEGVDATPVDLGADRSVDVTLQPGPQLRGRVVTTDGQPVAAAFVCVDTRFPTGRICRPTGSDGSYQVTTRPQIYVVQVVPPEFVDSEDLISEFWFRKRSWEDADQVTLGSSDRTFDLTVRRGLRVMGFVHDTRGLPLESATINLIDAAGPVIGAASDVTGMYRMVVPPGAYQIEVFAPFRGERGDLLSQPPRDLVVTGFTRHDFVLEDANP